MFYKVIIRLKEGHTNYDEVIRDILYRSGNDIGYRICLKSEYDIYLTIEVDDKKLDIFCNSITSRRGQNNIVDFEVTMIDCEQPVEIKYNEVFQEIHLNTLLMEMNSNKMVGIDETVFVKFTSDKVTIAGNSESILNALESEKALVEVSLSLKMYWLDLLFNELNVSNNRFNGGTIYNGIKVAKKYNDTKFYLESTNKYLYDTIYRLLNQ